MMMIVMMVVMIMMKMMMMMIIMLLGHVVIELGMNEGHLAMGTVVSF